MTIIPLELAALSKALLREGGVFAPEDATQSAVSSAQPAAADPFEALRELKGLVDDGVITQEEFAQTKAALLRRIASSDNTA